MQKPDEANWMEIFQWNSEGKTEKATKSWAPSGRKRTDAGRMATASDGGADAVPPLASVDGGVGGVATLELVAVLQMTLLVAISAAGTAANALVFAVFYRRPSLRTISNR